MSQNCQKFILLSFSLISLSGCSQNNKSAPTSANPPADTSSQTVANPQTSAQPFIGKWTIIMPEGGGLRDEIHLKFLPNNQVLKNDVIAMVGEQGKSYSQTYKWSSLSDGTSKYLILDHVDQTAGVYVWSFDKTMKFQWSVSDDGKYLSLTSGMSNMLGVKEDFLLAHE